MIFDLPMSMSALSVASSVRAWFVGPLLTASFLWQQGALCRHGPRQLFQSCALVTAGGAGPVWLVVHLGQQVAFFPHLAAGAPPPEIDRHDLPEVSNERSTSLVVAAGCPRW